MQGAKYCVILDSLVNDFVSGELEHAVHTAWKESKPRFIVVEGQGSLLNPAYPGGFEILAATRPNYIILQHAPARIEYDGFPGYQIHSLSKQIKAMEVISGKTVTAITINYENMEVKDVIKECKVIEKLYGIPASDVLIEGEIYVIKILQENPFLTGKAKHIEPVKQKNYLQSELIFESSKSDPVHTKWEFWETDKEKHCVLSSGGKDSLLSYGLSNELGFDTHPIFVNESGRHWFTALNAYKYFKENVPSTGRVWVNSDRVFNFMLKHLSLSEAIL